MISKHNKNKKYEASGFILIKHAQDLYRNHLKIIINSL